VFLFAATEHTACDDLPLKPENIQTCKQFNTHSFIHKLISNIYIEPLQEKLLRGAHNSSAAEKNSLQVRKERDR